MVGYKIGCTSAVMQEYIDIPHPCGGGVFARACMTAASELRPPTMSASASNARSRCGWRAIWRRPRRRSPPNGSLKPIEAYHPAIEIVDDRYVKWETMGAPTLIADDFFAAGCVLGEAVARASVPDLQEVSRPRHHQWRGGRPRHRRRRARPSPQCARLARQPSGRRGQGTACGADRADRKPGQDGVAERRRQACGWSWTGWAWWRRSLRELSPRHCERSESNPESSAVQSGLLRFARNDGAWGGGSLRSR